MPSGEAAQAAQSNAASQGRVLLQHAAYGTLGLTNKQVAVADAIWTLCQGRPAVIFASYAAVAELARCDGSTARKAFKALADAQILRVLEKPRGGATVHVYSPDRAVRALRARLHESDPQLELEFPRTECLTCSPAPAAPPSDVVAIGSRESLTCSPASLAPPSDVVAVRSRESSTCSPAPSAPLSDVVAVRSRELFFGSETGRRRTAGEPPASRRPDSSRESRRSSTDPLDLDLAELSLSSTVLAIAAESRPAAELERHARCDVHQTSNTSLEQTSVSCAERTSLPRRTRHTRDRPPPHENYSDLEPLWGLRPDHPRVKAYALELLELIRRAGDRYMQFGPCLRVAAACTHVLYFRDAEIERSFDVAARLKPTKVPLGKYLIGCWRRKFVELNLKW